MPADEPTPTPAQRFAAIIAPAARKAGYDIDSERGGGRAALARDTGMTASSVGRMLNGKSLPHPRFYEALARCVNLSVRDLLVEAEIISPQALTQPQSSRVASPITPERAADELGFSDPIDRELFLGMVARMRARRAAGRNGDTENGGGGESTAMDG
ncbi:helix-turn-helix transcriptional regulator [Streptomyces sp. B15]|uniref:helix-turn-helix domain-containing protein n=1 Tax=Streptomyces sp. B15 TaxID=1537797 RepID=UPI001B370CE6|nr:helix-turn-helix transcriptional regulator [Streptomyces sp. B15]MBQ1122584.1 helix-turn-helix transcriptional regulator [Streptomyces sp. B15]